MRIEVRFEIALELFANCTECQGVLEESCMLESVLAERDREGRECL